MLNIIFQPILQWLLMSTNDRSVYAVSCTVWCHLIDSIILAYELNLTSWPAAYSFCMSKTRPQKMCFLTTIPALFLPLSYFVCVPNMDPYSGKDHNLYTKQNSPKYPAKMFRFVIKCLGGAKFDRVTLALNTLVFSASSLLNWFQGKLILYLSTEWWISIKNLLIFYSYWEERRQKRVDFSMRCLARSVIR